eukprot:2593980-Lingulodinium_polyedra.AAC.1
MWRGCWHLHDLPCGIQASVAGDRHVVGREVSRFAAHDRVEVPGEVAALCGLRVARQLCDRPLGPCLLGPMGHYAGLLGRQVALMLQLDQ